MNAKRQTSTGSAFTGTSRCVRCSSTTRELSLWTVPVRGDDAYQIAVGPVHAGVIESGHFRFHVVGDRILHLDARLFFKHRGLEQAAQGQTLDRWSCLRAAGLRRLRRLQLARLRAGLRASNRPAAQPRARPSADDLARARTHLEPPQRHRRRLRRCRAGGREQPLRRAYRTARRLNEGLTGHRFLFDTVQVGSSRLTADAATVASLRAELASRRSTPPRRLAGAALQRLLPGPLARRRHRSPPRRAPLGAVGPAARACGIGRGRRSHAQHLCSPHRLRAGRTPRPAGDVQARLEQRWSNYSDLRAARPAYSTGHSPRQPNGQVRPGGRCRPVESPRGATTLHRRTSTIVVRGCTCDRLLRQLARSGRSRRRDNLLPDFPLINKSFELCYACVDR